MKQQGIDIGIESMIEPTLVVEAVYDADVALDLMEEALLLEGEVSELGEMIKFADNVTGIAASVKEHGIDAGTEALVGPAMKGYFEKWDAEDAEGTAEVLVAGLEGVGEKIAEAVRKIIERIRQFFTKIMLNETGVRKAYSAQRIRMEGLKNFVWTKGDKTFKVPGDCDKGKAEAIYATAWTVLDELKSSEFNIDKKVKPEFLNGSVLKTLRAQDKKTTEFKCASEKAESVWKDLLKAAADALDYVADGVNNAKVLKSINIKSVEEGTGNSVPPARAASTAASIFSWYNIYYLKVARSNIAILKNIK